MSDILIRTEGHAGRITLNRPKALNALTWEMCLQIETALRAWADDPTVKLVLIDGAGEKAFCAGGDIADLYASGQRGDYDYGKAFWRDEYRLNALIHNYAKPVVTFLHGFTMGGGVGIGCHASHRIVCENSQIAMPECTIGLVPDVGGSLLLAKAPGFVGTYLGLTGDRMDAGDALFVGFADHFVPQAAWDDLKQAMITAGEVVIPNHPAPASKLSTWQAELDMVFGAPDLATIYGRLDQATSEPAQRARKLMDRNAPLAMAVAVLNIAQLRQTPDMAKALDLEYRFTSRCVAQGDFIEGIRAAIIDRDRSPKWVHADWTQVSAADIATMTAPLGANALKLE